jgi:hypothetical protein
VKTVVTLLGLIVTALMFAVVATADVRLFPNQFLQYQGAGNHFWTARLGDSPHDANSRALRIRVGDPNAGEYVAAFSRRSVRLVSDASAQRNLSFEFHESTHVGAGAPRISIEFQNGDIAYLSAFYCNHPMAVTGDTWGRADFTRFRSNCSIFVTGLTGGQYSADGARSAWRVYTDANPDQVVEQRYFVADEAGTYLIDRLSLGANIMYTHSSQRGKWCSTEASC